MKKQLLCSALAVSTLVAVGASFAAALPTTAQDTRSFTGVYAGVDLGFRTVNYKLKEERNFIRADDASYDNSVTQATQGLHLGYGYEFSNQLYLGAKAFATISQGKEKASTTFGSTITRGNDLEFNELYGLNANFGYALTPTFLPYISAGYELMRVKNKVTDELGTTNEGFTVRKYANGFDAGIGLHYLMTSHIMLNAEYSAAWFSGVDERTTTNSLSQYMKLQAAPVLMGTVGFSYLF